MLKKAISNGTRFHRLVVVEELSAVKGCAMFRCRCDCGGELNVTGGRLRSSVTRSCGCLRREVSAQRMTTHGNASRSGSSAEYRAWRSILARCLNPNIQNYKRYGGRGIAVCDRWRKSFENFLADVGLRPSPGHSIDRFPDNDGNYKPGNVRWATAKEQAANRRPIKLSSLDVDHIRILAGQGWERKVLAQLYRVSPSHVGYVVTERAQRRRLPNP